MFNNTQSSEMKAIHYNNGCFCCCRIEIEKSCLWSLQILLEHRRRFINIETGIMQSGKHPIALAWIR